MECKFDAWYNRMPGTNDPDLHVGGTVMAPSSSVRVWLEPGDQGINPQPDEYRMLLRAEWPDAGDDRMTEREVEWHGFAGPDVKTVFVSGECDATLTVHDAV